MELAKLRLNSQVKVLVAFVVATMMLGLEARGPLVSKLVFVGLPALLAVLSGGGLLGRLIHFIVFAEVMIISLFWPVSVFSKALLFATLAWYLAEFPQRALANLILLVVVVAVAIISAPVTQQF